MTLLMDRPRAKQEPYVLVSGDRNWTSAKAVGSILRSLPQPYTSIHLIHGDAQGLDRIAGQIGSRMMMRVEGFPALWDAYGRAAGPIRNRLMLRHLIQARYRGHPCRVIAFHNDLESSKGTANMVKIARDAKFHVTVVRLRGS